MPDELPTAFADLPADAFPMTLEYIRMDTGKVVETNVLHGPGVLTVTGWAHILGVPIKLRVTSPDGQSTETLPPA